MFHLILRLRFACFELKCGPRKKVHNRIKTNKVYIPGEQTDDVTMTIGPSHNSTPSFNFSTHDTVRQAEMHRGNKSSRISQLDEVSHVHGHSLNCSIVVLFNVPQHAPILLSDEVDGHTFTTKTTTTADSVDVVFTMVR